MCRTKPKTIPELFEFYYARFKPLYSHIQALAQPPVEMLFEINAAFDHLSRLWHYSMSEERVVASASAHLKRGCFDAFKIVLRNTSDHYEELKTKVDVSLIDNGEFTARMMALFADIKAGATEARQTEGDSRDEAAWHNAFDLWSPVYEKCIRFDRDFYLSPKIEWAKRKGLRRSWRLRAEGIFIGLFVAAVCAGFRWVWACICALLSRLRGPA